MAGLSFDITGNNKPFLRALDECTRGMANATTSIENEGAGIEAIFQRISQAAAAMGIAFGAQELVRKVATVRGEFQQLEIAFETMLGSKDKADELMKQLVKTAAITPFNMKDVTMGAKQLLAYGTEAKEVNETLTRLGDIAAGLSIPLSDLVMLYGTTMTQGRMFTQDLRQFMGRGVPLADALARQFGVSVSKVGELVTAGKVGAAEFKAAIWDLSNEGSQFGGLMENQSKSITGQISNIEDAVETIFNDIGKETEGLISGTLSVVSAIVENWKSVSVAVLGVLGAFGLYKAEQLAIASIEKKNEQDAVNAAKAKEVARMAAIAPLQQEIDKLNEIIEAEDRAAEKAAMRDTLDNDIFKQYDAGNLSKDDAISMQGKRESFSSRVEEAQKEAELKAKSLAQAKEDLQLAKEREIAADARIKSVQEEINLLKARTELEYRDHDDEDGYGWIEDMQDEQEEAALAAELAAAQKEKTAAANGVLAASENVAKAQTDANTAATRAQTMAKMQNAASSKAKSAATNADTISGQANSAATNANTAATKSNGIAQVFSTVKTKIATTAQNLYTGAINAGKTALLGLKAAVMSNPLGMLITAVTTIIGMLPVFNDLLSDSSEEMENAFKDRLKEIDDEANKNRVSVERNYAILQNSAKNTKMYKDAMAELLEVMKEKGINLDSENDKYAALIANKERLIQLIIEETNQKRIQAENERIWQEYETYRGDAKTRMTETDNYIVGESENKEMYSELILSKIESEHERLTELKNQINKLFTDALMKRSKGDFEEADKLTSQAYALKRKMDDIVLEGARSASKKLGEDLQFNIGNVDSLMDGILAKYDQTTEKMNVLNTALSTSQDAADGLKTKIDFDWEAADSEQIVEQLKAVSQSGEEAKQRLTELGDTEVAPTVNKTQIDDTTDSADTATDAVDINLDSANAEPTTENVQIWDTESAAYMAKDAVRALGAATATPYVSTAYIDNFIDRILSAITLFKSIGGEVIAFTDKTQSARYQALATAKKKNGKLSADEEKEFQRLEAQGKRNTHLKVGNQRLEFTNPRDIAAFQYIIGNKKNFNTRGQIDPSLMTSEDRRMYDSLVKNKQREVQRQQMKSSQASWDKGINELKKKAKLGRSGKLSQPDIEAHDEAIKTLREEYPTGSKEYKELSAQLIEKKGKDKEKTNKSGKSGKKNKKTSKNKEKKNTSDPDEEEYELKAMKDAEVRRFAQAQKEVEFMSREFTIEKMPDGYRKDREKARLDAEKKRFKVEQDVINEAERIEEAEMKAWLKEQKGKKIAGKDVKEYMWYSDDPKYASDTKKRKSKEEYTAMAKANVGADTQMQKIDYNESEAIRKATIEMQKAQEDYLKKYGDFNQRRAAIRQQYQREISEAVAGGDEFAAFTLQQEMEEELREVDEAERKLTSDWSMIFGDLQNLTAQQLKEARDTLQQYMKDGSLSIEDYKTAASQINAINNKLIEEESQLQSIFGISLPYYQERKKLTMEAEQAQRNYNAALQEKDTASSGMRSAQTNISTTLSRAGVQEDFKNVSVDKTQEYLDIVGNKFGFDSKEYRDFENELRNLAKSATGVDKANRRITESGNALANSNSKLNSFNNDMQKKLENVTGIMQMVTQNIAELPGLFSELGVDEESKAGQIIAGVADAANNAMGAFTDFQNGNYVGALVKAISSVKSIISLFTTGNEAEVAEKTEELTEANERLTVSIDSLKDEINEARGGVKLLAKAQEALEMQLKKNENQRDILEAQMHKNGTHHSNSYYWRREFDSFDYKIFNKYLAQYAKENPDAKSTVNSVYSLDDVMKLTPEQLAYIRSHDPELWRRMTETGKYEDTAQYWEQYADLAGQLEEIQTSLKEALTQVSFDSLRDDFLSTLMDMDMDARKFSDKFSEYLMKSVLNAKMSDLLDDDLNSFYEKWAGLAGDADGLTEAEIAQLQAMWDSLVQKGMEIRDEAAEITGYAESQEQQEGSSRGFAGMSQDTADELNGRFTTMVELESQLLAECIRRSAEDNMSSQRFTTLLSAQLAHLATISTSANDANHALNEMRDMMFITTDKLVDIADNTKVIRSVSDKLDVMTRIIRSL